MKTKLCDMEAGEKGRVLRVKSESGEIFRRLLDMGLVEGAEVKVVRRAPLGDPVEIEIKGYYLSLRKLEAQAVEVER